MGIWGEGSGGMKCLKHMYGGKQQDKQDFALQKVTESEARHRESLVFIP